MPSVPCMLEFIFCSLRVTLDMSPSTLGSIYIISQILYFLKHKEVELFVISTALIIFTIPSLINRGVVTITTMPNELVEGKPHQGEVMCLCGSMWPNYLTVK